MNSPFSRLSLFGLLLVGLALLGISAYRRTGTSNAPPQNRGATPTGHSVTLNWKASTPVVVGYNVYRATQAGGPYAKVNSSPIESTSYADTTVHAGETYFYAVTAVDRRGVESTFSNRVQASVPSP